MADSTKKKNKKTTSDLHTTGTITRGVVKPEKNGEELKPILFTKSLFSHIFFPALALALVPVIISTFFIVIAVRKTLIPYVPQTEAILFLETIRPQVLLILLFVLVFSVFLSYVLSRSITRPISILIDAVQRIAAGKLNFQIDLKREDEIGRLAHFFNATVRQFVETQQRGLALSQIKSQFVTVAAHQLRTPLSAMKWTLRLVLDGDMGELNQKQQEFLQQSYQTNERIIRLVNDFLDISRIEEGRFGFHFRKVRIFDILKKSVDESQAQAKIATVRLIFKSTIPEDMELIIDEDRIYTVMMNIIDNAIRYNNTGGEVVVMVAIKGDYLEVRVIDNGIGIPPEEQKKIFSRFYRASNAISKQTEGSGLSLFIVRNIIRRHGGDVEFMSAKDKGATIFFTLPVKEDFIKKQELPLQHVVEVI